MKLGVLVVGHGSTGKTFTITKIKERLGITSRQYTFQCCTGKDGFIVAQSMEELNRYSESTAAKRLEKLCDNYQVVILPARAEDEEESYVNSYLKVFRSNKFTVVRLDVVNMKDDMSAWTAAQGELAGYVYWLVRYACPALRFEEG